MTYFWPLALAMTLLALVFVVPPLLRNRQRTTVDRNQLNTAVVKQQLMELQADLDAGKLDQAAYATARHDLERELLDELGKEEKTTPQDSKSGRWAALLLIPAIPLLAVMLYQQLGAENQSSTAQVQQAAATAQPPHNVEDSIAKLAQHLREQPDNLEGWALLARTYAKMNRFQESAEAYAQARQLSNDQPELLIDYADMLVAANGGDFNDEVGQLLQTAVQQQPGNLKGRWLLGHWKFQHGDNQGAIQDWQQVAEQLPAGNEKDLTAIGQQIALAQAKMTLDGSSALPAAQTSESMQGKLPGNKSIEVSVTLDAALASKVAADDTVFIYARAAKGPRMPLAIVRKKVSDLPLQVTLDDSMAMSPSMTLSSFSQVTLAARI
ncbi:Cytochrome c heme lyase subunit CcmH, partial [hydrothermal vent metagenome]